VLSVRVAEGVVANADATRFAQILTNLLHNATKFTPEGGAITVELTLDAGAAVLSVSDSGAGIRSDQLERVFDMFTRIRRNGAKYEPGLGIGLALARRLAEMHDGTLTSFSEGEGRGATFTLRIPALESVSRDAIPAANTVESSNGAAPLDIVVVEDNEDVAGVLVDWLENLGHRVRVAFTGTSGLEVIRSKPPDVVLCDLGLPELDGLGVCRRVLALPSESRPTMVALTGWGREDDIRRSREAGFDHHLVKPVAPDALQRVLTTVTASQATPRDP
jgi:CheY-like chemotaxis protein